jgi:ElaB/YqjD/DUF883 family membrane-anchored ribosome-binding protein
METTSEQTAGGASSSNLSDNREKLVADLKLVIKDAEELLRNAGSQMGSQVDSSYQSARARFDSTLQHARTGLGTAKGRATSQGQEMMDTADRYVQDYPWQSVGIGAVAGMVIGFLLSSRK